jgi:hypothetical protein
MESLALLGAELRSRRAERVAGLAPPGLQQHAAEHLSRRALLGAAGLAALAGISWLTPTAQLLAQQAERAPRGKTPWSLIFLWLAGGPSQLETFDPHPGKRIAGGTLAIGTSVKSVQLAKGLDRTAELVHEVALVRSLVTTEGDHERGTYLIKTGYVPAPKVVHPAIGAIICRELPRELPSGLRTDIPRHVSIFSGPWPARGGELGDQFDAFKTYDPRERVPDISPRVSLERFEQRLKDLDVVEGAFASSRRRQVARTGHRQTIDQARVMMTSEQLRAFDVTEEPKELRQRYGDTPFGRGCLAARRLIEVGVRCVEVTLDGWDTHINNHETTAQRVQVLDPALSALIVDLKERGLFDQTIVLCGGEFGRTPQVNPAAGRDHWPHGFSMLLAGGGIRGGTVIGATDPEGGKDVVNPQKIEDVHATVLHLLGINYQQEYIARVQRPIKLCAGQPISALMQKA